MDLLKEFSHMIGPFVGSLLYLSYPKNLRLPESFVFAFSVLHNLFLASFSAYTCYSLVSYMRRDGFVYKAKFYLSDEPNDYSPLIFAFYLSKYYEYVDTFLIYLKGKKPILLQTFHHLGAVVIWHLCYVYQVDAIVWGTMMNAGVHTIMYSYYFLSLFKIRLQFVKPFITAGQIIQLVMGNFTSMYMYFPPVESLWNYGIIVFFDVYMFFLIYMFIQFSYKNYVSKERKDRKKE